MGDVGGAISGIGGYFGAKEQADATKDAAETQYNAMLQAIETQRAAADEAKAEVLDRMTPALRDFSTQINNLQREVINGSADIMDIYRQSTAGADEMLQRSGANVRQILMGSTAMSQGVPAAQFNQQFERGTLGQPGDVSAPSLPGLEGRPGDLATEVPGGIAPPTTGGIAGGIPADYQPRTLGEAASGTSRTGLSAIGGALAGAAQTAVDAARDEMAAERARDYESPILAPPTGTSPTMPTLPGATVPPGGTGGVATGYAGAQGALEQGLAGGLGAMARGASTARGDISRALAGGLGEFEPYAIAGQSALAQEAALSGAMGPEAQQAAIDAYIESPGQKYLREKQQEALLRSSAAIGGLGGGNVRTALQEQAMGIASTQQQQHLENLRSLAGRGQEVAGARAGMITGAGTQLAGIAERLGVSASDLMRMSAQDKAALAERAGIRLADLEQATQSARITNLQQLASQLAGTRAAETADIVRLGETGALTGLGTQQNIGTLLSNLAVGAGTNIANLQAAGGSALAAGQLGAGMITGNMYSQLGNLAGSQIPSAGQGWNMYQQFSQPQQTTYSQPTNQYTSQGYGAGGSYYNPGYVNSVQSGQAYSIYA